MPENWERKYYAQKAATTRVQNERDRLKEGKQWSWESFAVGVIIGFFALALIGLVVKIVGWAIGVIIGALELLIALAALAMLVWGAIWLFRKLAHNIQESPDSDQNPVRNLLERLRKNVRASMSSRTKEVNS